MSRILNAFGILLCIDLVACTGVTGRPKRALQQAFDIPINSGSLKYSDVDPSLLPTCLDLADLAFNKYKLPGYCLEDKACQSLDLNKTLETCNRPGCSEECLQTLSHINVGCRWEMFESMERFNQLLSSATSANYSASTDGNAFKTILNKCGLDYCGSGFCSNVFAPFGAPLPQPNATVIVDFTQPDNTSTYYTPVGEFRPFSCTDPALLCYQLLDIAAIALLALHARRSRTSQKL